MLIGLATPFNLCQAARGALPPDTLGVRAVKFWVVIGQGVSKIATALRGRNFSLG